MREKQLMIGIPTKDHPKYIQYYLAKILPASKKYNIDIYIYDSSVDDETEGIVKRRVEQGYSNLFYRRFHEEILIEDKLGYIFINNKYEYIWLCGDGVIASLEKDMDILLKEMEKGRDLILFGQALEDGFARGYNYTGNNYIEYTDIVKFLEDCWAPLTYYGASVVRGNLFSKKQWDEYRKKYKEQVQPACFFEVFKEGEFNGVYIVQDFFEANPYKIQAEWVKKGRLFDAFTGIMANTINSLPHKYDASKKKIEKSLDKYTGSFSFSHLWILRSNGNLNLKKALKYRRQIRRMCLVNYKIILIVAICPKKIADTVAVILGNTW